MNQKGGVQQIALLDGIFDVRLGWALCTLSIHVPQPPEQLGWLLEGVALLFILLWQDGLTRHLLRAI